MTSISDETPQVNEISSSDPIINYIDERFKSWQVIPTDFRSKTAQQRAAKPAMLLGMKSKEKTLKDELVDEYMDNFTLGLIDNQYMMKSKE